MELHTAQRKQAKIKLTMEGVSGSGKSMSSLLLASEITDWSKIAVIDTENHSADLHAHLGQYNVFQLSMHFTQKDYESVMCLKIWYLFWASYFIL
jgi:CO dehydrogenase nickel-insertion accessory protein CooC1